MVILLKKIVFFSLAFIGASSAIIWQLFFNTDPDYYPLDLWSVTHFIVFFLLASLLSEKISDKNFVFFLCFVVSILYEILEYFSYMWIPSLATLSSESLINIIVDVLVNTIGIATALAFADNKKIHHKSFYKKK